MRRMGILADVARLVLRAYFRPLRIHHGRKISARDRLSDNEKSAEFYCDYLVEDKDGYLIAAPSTSPENNFVLNGSNCAVSQTTTMTMSIIRELFENCIKASDILGEDKEFAEILKDKLKNMLPFRIGKRVSFSSGTTKRKNRRYTTATARCSTVCTPRI